MLIDTSHYQRDRGPINWNEVASPFVQGVIVKATEGTGYVDPTWTESYAGARAAGLAVGAYHFADLGDPIAEANHFADVYLSQGGWNLRPVLDIETAGATAGWIIRFRAQFRAQVPHPFLRVYSNYSLLTGTLDPARWIDSQTDIWIARYNNTLGWNHPQAALWQMTSTATIPGIVGSVDENQFLNGWTPARDAAELGQPVPKPPVPPAPHPITGKLPAGTVLRRGSTGPAVRVLQQALDTQYPAYSRLVVDGVYGPHTEAVVREFQTRWRPRIAVDGIAGPQTLHALGLL